MKHMRKIIALVIAMVMMAAMVVPTMAADGKSITITGGKKGHTYTAYQILTGTVDGNELKNIQWGDGVTSGWINGRIAAAFAKTLTDEAAAKALAEGPEEAEAVPEKVIMTTGAGEIKAPVEGKVISREAIPDATFASGVLGDGVGIEPEAETVYAPFDGTVSTVAESKHAVGLSGAGDMELLIHVGVDTVAMNGDGFQTFVNEGDEVKAGQKLLTFDKKKIAAANHPDVVVVLLTNAEDFDDFKVTP